MHTVGCQQRQAMGSFSEQNFKKEPTHLEQWLGESPGVCLNHYTMCTSLSLAIVLSASLYSLRVVFFFFFPNRGRVTQAGKSMKPKSTLA